MANKQSHTGSGTFPSTTSTPTPSARTPSTRSPYDDPETSAQPSGTWQSGPSSPYSPASSPSASTQPSQLKDKVSEGIEQAKDKLSDVKGAVSAKAEEGVEMAKRTMHGAQAAAGKAIESVGQAVKANPIPIAMAAVGLGWLTVSLLRGGSHSMPSSTSAMKTEDVRRPGSVQRAGEKAMERGRALQHKAMDFAQESPLLAGAALIGVGALLGLLVPSSQRENQWLGKARDRFIDSAQNMARKTLDKIESAAHAVTTSGETSTPQTTH